MHVLPGSIPAVPLTAGGRHAAPGCLRNAEHRHDSFRLHHATYQKVARSRAARLIVNAAAPSKGTSRAKGKTGTKDKSGPRSDSPNFPIDVKCTKQPRSHLKLSVTLPPPMVKRAYADALDHYSKTTDLPGFRKGRKVPMDVLLRTMAGGENALKKAAIEHLMEVTLPTALTEYEKVAINESVQIESSIDDLLKAFDPNKSLQYEVGIDVAPTVTWKTPYRDISVEVEAAGSEESDRAAVAQMLRTLRKENGKLRVVIDRGLQAGDVVICDFDAERADEGEQLIGAKRDAMRLDTETADQEFLPGLVDGMIGMKVGDEKTISITLPDTWQPAQLRGVPANCTVKVKEIFQWDLPELTDEFVAKQIRGCSSVAEAEEKLFEARRLNTAELTQQRIVNALSVAVADAVEADVPECLMRQMGEQEYQKSLLDLQQEGKLSMEALQSLANDQMLANYINGRRDELDHLNRAILGFEEIYRAEGLQITDEEVQAEFESAAEGFRTSGQEFDEQRLREQATETVKAMKTLDFLQKTCTINVKEYSGNEAI